MRRDGAGFRDALSVDFVDPEAAACGLVRVEVGGGAVRGRGALLTPGGEAVTTREGDPPGEWDSIELDGVRISDDGHRASASMQADAGGFEIELTRLAGAALEPGSGFADAAGLSEEAFAARLEGSWHAGGASGTIECVGRIVRTSGETHWDRVELVRSLTVALDDGSVLALASARPGGASGHGEEVSSALLADSDRALARFDEPLVSTEYDPAGEPRRVGVELWPSDDDGVAVRGAGTAVGSAASSTFLRFTLDGKPGTARYELARAP